MERTSQHRYRARFDMRSAIARRGERIPGALAHRDAEDPVEGSPIGEGEQ